MNATTRIRGLSIPLLIASLVLGATACDMGPTFGPGRGGNMCLMGGCGGGGGYSDYGEGWTGPATDSAVILLSATTITLGDTLWIRVKLYPDSAMTYSIESIPQHAAHIAFRHIEPGSIHIYTVVPVAIGTARVRTTNYGTHADTLVLQVVPRLP